ncbi:MAG TPA: radical SAM protein [Candidatus Saccharimonadales bacterium]|nr:radical SAM protein [Candidatus Saccharimonadales bacterium]
MIKIHRRCNLKCEPYCYMFFLKDQSWRDLPKAMTVKTARTTIKRIVEYVREHQLSATSIVLHGGEPLLASMAIFRLFASIRSMLPGVLVDISVQTNATMLTEAIAEEFFRLGITVGVSLDGDEAFNGMRLYHNGRSSHADVLRGLNILRKPRYKGLLDAILSYTQFNRDPATWLDYMSQFGVPIDPLRPLGNWDEPPPGIVTVEDGYNPYGDWYSRLFDHWVEQKMQPRILIFEKIIQHIAGYALDFELAWFENIEMIGPWIMGAIAVDVDGSYALPDWYKSVEQGEDSLFGLNVFDDKATRALYWILRMTDERGIPEGASECQSCDIFSICGGGLPSERAKLLPDGSIGYRNRSVYCGDLYDLVLHIMKRLNEAPEDSFLRVEFRDLLRRSQQKLQAARV